MANILIVDDDKQIRSMLKQMLEREGHQVNTACDGVQALSAMLQKIPDLVITDLIMPEKEGLELIRELRRYYPDLKIVVITGGSRLIKPGGYLNTARLLGANLSFQKPIERKEFVSSINNLLYANEYQSG